MVLGILFGWMLSSSAFGAEGATSAFAASPQVSGLDWRWSGEPRRYRIETEVLVPSFMWFIADNNLQARVSAWQVGLVLNCPSAVPSGKKAWQVECQIEDAALRAAALPGDQATASRPSILNPVLDELDRKLTGATIQIGLKKDGRVTMVDIEGLERANRRIGQMNEILRQVVSRAIAGFDLELPEGGVAPASWTQRSSQLMVAPNQVGTFGGTETVHRVFQVIDATTDPGLPAGQISAVLQSTGRGTIAPMSGASDAPQNLYSCKLESVAVFDATAGLLTERVWAVEGEPTASSAITEGGAGIPYYQHGQLNWIRPGEPAPGLGKTEEIASPGQASDVLRPWRAVGTLGAGTP